MRKLAFKAFNSFSELKKDYEAEVRAMTPAERIASMENLRRDYFRVKGLAVTDKVERILEIGENNITHKHESRPKGDKSI